MGGGGVFGAGAGRDRGGGDEGGLAVGPERLVKGSEWCLVLQVGSWGLQKSDRRGLVWVPRRNRVPVGRG